MTSPQDNLRNPVRRTSRTRLVLLGIGIALLAIFGLTRLLPAASSTASAPHAPAPIVVDVAVAKQANVPIYLEGLGTVQAFNTVTITPRVSGALEKVGFVEGQSVKAGDLLAQIDPRPYQAAYDQAVATRDKDAAQLANAKRDLKRYIILAPQNFTSRQTLDTQRALVAQLVAQVEGDQAAIESAKTQLDYATITSPISGRTGIRQVDAGNNVTAGTTAGIVVVTQMQPISVIFTLPEETLLQVGDSMAKGPVMVTALAEDGRSELDRGTILLIDNEIDQSTGTIRLKATFPNKKNRLWPGAFVDAKVLVQTRKNALVIPSEALQRGPNGVYAYVVKPGQSVEMRPLEIGGESGDLTIVTGGLQAGERVTVSNAYRLQPGAHVSVTKATKPKTGGDSAP